MTWSLKKQNNLNVISDFHSNGVIVSENVRKEATLAPLGIMGQDSSQTQTGDFGAAAKTITVDAIKIDTPANLSSFVQLTLDPLVNGLQIPALQYPYKYNSDILGTINVKFLSVDYTYSRGSVRYLMYTLRMVQSAVGV